MNITYLYRHPGTGHSIEALFGSVQREVEQQSDSTTRQVCLPYISRGLWSVWQNLRFLRGLTADIFHITGDVHYAALALPASRTVLTIHDCSTLQKNTTRPLRYALFWLLWYYLPIRRAGTVTVISEKTRQELISYLGRAARKAVVVPNGYDPAFTYQPAALRNRTPVLLQVGTAPNKNVLRLLQALEGIPCTLLLVGPLTGTLLNHLQKHRISYRQFEKLDQAQLIQLYTRCDIVTFISTYEGFGMPVLEANAVGRVVISANLSPMTDVAPGAAHFVDPADTALIRTGILKLLHDPPYRQQLIDVGKVNAQRFTIAEVTAQYLTLYQKIADLKPAFAHTA